MTTHHHKINGLMAMQSITTRAASHETAGGASGEGRPGILRKILQAALVLLTLGWAAGAHAAGSTISLSAGPNPVIVGQPLTLSASVTAASPKGTVTFMSGGATLGTATVSGGVATLSYTFTSAGSYSLTAVYSPITVSRAPVSIGAFTSPTVALTVNKAPTTTAVVATPSPSTVGQPATITATMTGYNPSGTVTFYDGATAIGTGAISNGTATLTYTFTTAVVHNLTASYPGDANNLSSTSSAFAQTVNKAPTTTTVAATPSPSTVGQSATITATVTGYLPGGTVTFMDGTTTLGTGTIANGTATLTYTFTTAAVHSLTASYAGDANNLASTSSAFAQTVNKAPTTTTVAATPSPSTVGQAATLTATVTGYLPGGTVTFMDGTTTLGTGTIANGTATLSYTFTAVGAHNLTASYAGDANNLASTSSAFAQTVNKAPTTTTVVATPSPSTVGQAATLTATVTGYLPGGTVTFMDGTTTLGTGTIANGVATLSYAFTTGGAHSLTGVYAGDANNAASTSAPVAQTVNAAATTTVLATSPNPSNGGQAVTLTAAVKGYQPSGTVTFMDGATQLGTGALANGTATLSHAFTTGGSHSLTAVYGGDAANQGSTSAAVAQTVNTLAGTTTTLTISPGQAPAGQAVTLTAVVTGAAPTGAVSFYDTSIPGFGPVPVGGTRLDSTGKAVVHASLNANVGPHNIIAVYAGDASNASSTSAPVVEIVLSPTTTKVRGTPNPSTLNQTITLTATVTPGISGTPVTGSVAFMEGATPLGTGTLNGAGVATLSHAFPSGGAHSLTAVYSGDVNCATSTSAAYTQTVGQTASATTLSSSANPAAPNQTVTLNAVVTGTLPTGTVTFHDGTTVLGTGTLNPSGLASLDYAFPAGAHSLTATYGGDANNTASTSAAFSQTVAAGTSHTTLASSANPAAPGQPVTLTAAVAGASPSGAVTFYNGATVLGTGTLNGAGAATLSYTFASAGAYSLTAAYAGDAGNGASASAVLIQGVATAAKVYYINPDQLDTPRAITDTSGNLVWSWDNQDPFGNNTPNENPSSQGQFNFNLRFPGQYFDTETNLAYNVNRDYDPAIGRYIQSDPIGLWGGINTYTYVEGNPLKHRDILGLTPNVLELTCVDPVQPACVAGAALDLLSDIALMVGLAGSTVGSVPEHCPPDKSTVPPPPPPDDPCDKKLSDSEIKRLQKGAVDVHEEKTGFGGSPSHFDLYKCKNGDIVVKRKGGGAIVSRTGLNLGNY